MRTLGFISLVAASGHHRTKPKEVRGPKPPYRLTAQELAAAFVNRVYNLHGCPDIIFSDRGTQFISQFWKHLSARLGTAL